MNLVEKHVPLMEHANHLERPEGESHIDGKTVRNVAYVPGRLVNVVVG